MVSLLALRPALSETSKHILVKDRDLRVDSALAVAFVLQISYYNSTSLILVCKSLYNLHVALFETVLKKYSGIKSGMKTDGEHVVWWSPDASRWTLSKIRYETMECVTWCGVETENMSKGQTLEFRIRNRLRCRTYDKTYEVTPKTRLSKKPTLMTTTSGNEGKATSAILG